jgi:hypothetical protein
MDYKTPRRILHGRIVMDYRRLSILFVSVVLLSCFSFSGFAQAEYAASMSSLLGRWQCQSYGETIPLIFESQNRMVFDGEAADYTLVPGAIRVEEAYGFVDYGYALEENTLLISFPGGMILQCMREASAQEKTAKSLPQKTSPAQGTSPPVQSGSSKVASGEVGDPNWGFKFRAPQGWKFNKDHNGAILGHDTIAGMIIVFPHYQTSLQAVAQEMQEGLVEEEIYLMPSAQLQQKGNNMLWGDCSGTWQGQQARGRGFGTLSPYGGGAYVLAITTPEKFGAEIAAAAEAIAGGMQYFKVDVSHLTRIFVGRWASYSGSSGGGTLRNWTFHPDGTFEDASETSYSTNYSSDGMGMPDTNLGALGTSTNRARWTVRGGEREGQIIITYPNGNERFIDYAVHVERGQTYWREYFFNRQLFRKGDTF